MEEHYLIVSHPPHAPSGIADVAELMGLTPAEFRVKVNYPVPEVWFADPDRARVDAFAGSLRGAGLNVISIAGRELADLPQPEPVHDFQFGEAELGLRLGASRVELPYGLSLNIVFCQSRKATPVPDSRVARNSLSARLSHTDLSPITRRPSVIEAASHKPSGVSSSFVEIYTRVGTALRRLALVEGTVDFSELPSGRGTNHLTAFVDECGKRFPRAHIDRRLVGLRPRQPLQSGSEVKAITKRKGFSYATRTLESLLLSLEPSLATARHAELASRLVFLTCRASAQRE